MDSGFYAACAGLMAKMASVDIVAHNLANSSTNAFKAKQNTFAAVMAGANSNSNLNRVINQYNVAGGSWRNMGESSLEHTGNNLDLALEGPGFFVVDTKAGPAYTRDGHFHISNTGELVTESGERVLADSGPVNVEGGTISVALDGTVVVAGSPRGKLRRVEFNPGANLEDRGDQVTSAGEGVSAGSRTIVRQGYLEPSNVNPVGEMVSLIAAQRSAQMLNRALSMFHSEFNRIAAGELARV